jgi:hypothetical protein
MTAPALDPVLTDHNFTDAASSFFLAYTLSTRPGGRRLGGSVGAGRLRASLARLTVGGRETGPPGRPPLTTP